MPSWLKKQLDTLIRTKVGSDIEARTNKLAVKHNEFGFDSFGFSKDSLLYPMLVSRWLYRSYFRTQVFGMENIPKQGRVIFVSNHSGQLPFDGLVICTALFLEPKSPRIVRSMVEHFVPKVPFVSYLLNRWGQITGTPENCRKLLQEGQAILVFPEGIRGISKPFSQRYQLTSFGLGFMRLALENNAPIVPVGVIGAEEQAPAINLRRVAKFLGTPSFPVVPYPPFVPLFPLPVKYRLHFGKPLHFQGDADDEDDIVQRKVQKVHDAVTNLVTKGLEQRTNVFW